MSCNCGCHDDKPPATGWRRFVPLILGLVVIGTLIAGVLVKNNDKATAATGSGGKQTSAAPRP